MPRRLDPSPCKPASVQPSTAERSDRPPGGDLVSRPWTVDRHNFVYRVLVGHEVAIPHRLFMSWFRPASLTACPPREPPPLFEQEHRNAEEPTPPFLPPRTRWTWPWRRLRGGRRHACVREILVWVSCFGDLAGLALTCVRRYVCESGTVCRWKQLCNLERYVVYFGMFVWLSLEEVCLESNNRVLFNFFFLRRIILILWRKFIFSYIFTHFCYWLFYLEVNDN